ncbi:MAG: hypothetical protein NPIRA04_36650 [Nitrospirales bacterium]|nr:MAG: hypothetical protein NPIRA04_36650 [Nitrospirales bacterium]
MDSLPEFVGTVHIFLGPYRGNPIALYMRQEETMCHISPRVYPWNRTVGSGETPNKAAAAFEAKWKENDLAAEMYSGPHWEGGIKPEKPKPPPKPAAPKPAAPAAAGAPATAAKPNAPAAKSNHPAATGTQSSPSSPPAAASTVTEQPTPTPDAQPATATNPQTAPPPGEATEQKPKPAQAAE